MLLETPRDIRMSGGVSEEGEEGRSEDERMLHPRHQNHQNNISSSNTTESFFILINNILAPSRGGSGGGEGGGLRVAHGGQGYCRALALASEAEALQELLRVRNGLLSAASHPLQQLRPGRVQAPRRRAPHTWGLQALDAGPDRLPAPKVVHVHEAGQIPCLASLPESGPSLGRHSGRGGGDPTRPGRAPTRHWGPPGPMRPLPESAAPSRTR